MNFQGTSWDFLFANLNYTQGFSNAIPEIVYFYYLYFYDDILYTLHFLSVPDYESSLFP